MSNAELTDKEKKALDLTVQLWQALHDLPELHPSDLPEAARDIHNIQNRINGRIAVRLDLLEDAGK